jgi:mRNA-degrading endonuclease RelE of RelBE toxin-antitoxin system
MQRMYTVIESPSFSKLWPYYWREEERGAFAAFLSGHPTAGDVIPGSGGLRKVRWSRAGSGKSGGVRVIYFSINEAGELVLLTMYAKSKTENLTAQQLKEIKHARSP